MNMSCSLAGFYIIFLIAGHAAPVAVLCGISAALLQYFMLVYFGWTAAEAVYLYIKLVKVLGPNIARYVLKAALIVWCKYHNQTFPKIPVLNKTVVHNKRRNGEKVYPTHVWS